MNLKPGDELVTFIQTNLINWYKNFGRNFPWRRTRNPFFVLLAEKLLQQTSVKPILIEIYQEFINSYPTVWHLSIANPEDVRGLISPLGLHYRATEVVRMANDIMEKFNGEIPSSLESLLSIFGIGEYSARAVLCFAYGMDIPLVDTNIARIIYRVFDIQGRVPENPARKKSLIELAGILLPKGKSREFNWALIDHGALICKARRPQCPSCPINQICVYYKGFGESYKILT